MSGRLATYLNRLPAAVVPLASDPLAGTSHPGASFLKQLGGVALPWRCAILVMAHALATILLLASWYFLGIAALGGRSDPGWISAWAVALASTLPVRALSRWMEGVVAIAFGGLLKQRLLVGAMQVDVDLIRTRGMGRLMSEVLESDAIDSLGAAHAVQGGLALLELALIAVVFGWGAAGGFQVTVLVAVLVLAGLFMRRNLRLRSQWTSIRLGLTSETIESMVAHRTRLAQQAPTEWHAAEDRNAARYLAISHRLDRSTTQLQAAVPRTYVIGAIVALGPTFVSGQVSLAELAITLGGVLFAASALERLVVGFARGSAAWFAWCAVKPTFQAASPAAEVREETGTESQSGRILLAKGLEFTHDHRSSPTLKGCTLAVDVGDKILLQGESGSGKSTLAALIAGLRTPSSGFILARGLDRQTLGDAGWHQRVAAAPQYHENHILSASLGFNLLLARPFPHTETDLIEAWELCQELGLRGLIERMPSGLNQMVGETGWRLSQGERSRVFLARALLQGADVVLVDESLAALDPGTLSQCLECVMRRANALILIAHP